MLTDVFLVYGRYTAGYLRNLTHTHTTWKNHYHESQKNLIPNEEIREYFKTLEPIEITPNIEKTIGYFDEDGYTVLPKEWNDEP